MAMKRDRVEIAEKQLNAIPKNDMSALRVHFNYHTGHCVICRKKLEKVIYPLDLTQEERRERGYLFRLRRLTACEEHQKRFKGRDYATKKCECCGVKYISLTQRKSPFCSLACRNYSDYQKNKNRKRDYKYKAVTHRKKSCKHCRIYFFPKRSGSIFCSGKCRVAYHRLMKRVTQFELPMTS